MIDLNAPVRTVLGVDLAADSEDPLLLHVMPAPPQVALVEGGPDLQLLRFVQDGALTGGHLRLSVDLRHRPELLDEVVAELNRDPARAAQPFRIAPAAVSRATAQLVFLGQEPNGQGGLTPMLARPYADAIGQLPAPHTASFSVELTPAGVQILEAALRSAGAPIAVVVRLDVEGLWPAQRVVARVDWGRVYDHLSTHLKQGWLLGVDDIATVVEQLREDRSIQISAVQSLSPDAGGSPAELDAALAWIQRELVERFCEPVLPLARTPAHASLGTMGEIFGVGTSFAAKALTQVERAVATVDFQVARVLTRTYTVQSHLADVLMGSSMDDHIADAGLDHPFFQRFALRVRAAQPLADLHLAEVVGELAYGSAHLPVRLVPDAPETTVDCWADASADRSWTFSATARFADDAPLGGGQPAAAQPVRADPGIAAGPGPAARAGRHHPRPAARRTGAVQHRDGAALAWHRAARGARPDADPGRAHRGRLVRRPGAGRPARRDRPAPARGRPAVHRPDGRRRQHPGGAATADPGAAVGAAHRRRRLGGSRRHPDRRGAAAGGGGPGRGPDLDRVAGPAGGRRRGEP